MAVSQSSKRTRPVGWRAQAACIGMDPDIFFPSRGQRTERGKAVCRACPVQEDCLEYALEAGENIGIWGGYAAEELRLLRRQTARRRRQEEAVDEAV